MKKTYWVFLLIPPNASNERKAQQTEKKTKKQKVQNNFSMKSGQFLLCFCFQNATGFVMILRDRSRTFSRGTNFYKKKIENFVEFVFFRLTNLISELS